MSDGAGGDILFERRGALGLVTLNRPKAMNALTHAMALALEARLRDWAEDDAIAAVAIVGAGERAFCAGGDVRRLYEDGRIDGRRNFAFYADEYRLNALIRRYPKPYLAFMDGIVMGGGVGVAIHGSHRIAGDATLFAMPETGIGLFPDVGGAWFLPRLPGETGLWLGLTGARLKAGDAVAAGVCDLYAPSAAHGAALDALAAGASPDAALGAIAQPAPGPSALAARRGELDRLFAGGSIAEVLDALEGAPGEWAAAQAAAIRSKSPTCTAIAFRQIRLGATLDFEACMALEYRLACFCMTRPDFYEGVRAAIIERDGAPRWSPATLEEVDPAEIDRAFAFSDGAAE